MDDNSRLSLNVIFAISIIYLATVNLALLVSMGISTLITSSLMANIDLEDIMSGMISQRMAEETERKMYDLFKFGVMLETGCTILIYEVLSKVF